ncbi:nucleotide sugar dehydrogenase [Hoeflea sp. YIM 152468]|uniref:nucleotide sugar dehydrogenase n=1 Tax=Hoeflea sp. YIM 152468 TaxID=3031759 RepID=UPI0023DBC55A|nr:nucleotide sugar dehydrogenase [Hoeflea sp. YIM 152468]MDF1610259.1 nucleotide sugar dehydrogenase [Hoeflea sp. YIM 152468]
MKNATDESIQALLERIERQDYTIGIVGLGYVGIPLALVACSRGFHVIGFDIDHGRVDDLNVGRSTIKHIPSEKIAQARESGTFEATTDFSRMGEADAILIAVPTPLNKYREPDLSFVVKTTEAVAAQLRPGQLIVLESTTYPGTTNEVMRPIFERSGLVSGKDFFLAYSPEREDPGNRDYETATIPKVVGGDGDAALQLAVALYSQLVAKTVPVSSTATAEAVKLTENIFRSVNIALVNELKVVYEAMGVDVWEVIDAAKTKPFGFMPFYPGPGLGGHCIPIDPFYLTWKAREFDISTRFIELAGEINTRMPYIVVEKLAQALDQSSAKGLHAARILLIGIAYKKNVDDMRESPSLKLIDLIEARGASVDYHDPYIPVIPVTREHASLAGRKSVEFTPETVRGYDAILIATDHDNVDYSLLVEHGKVVIDTRNAIRKAGIATAANVFKA